MCVHNLAPWPEVQLTSGSLTAKPDKRILDIPLQEENMTCYEEEVEVQQTRRSVGLQNYPTIMDGVSNVKRRPSPSQAAPAYTPKRGKSWINSQTPLKRNAKRI